MTKDVTLPSHIRQTLPPLGGNSFYRDKRDRTAHAKTLCGAAVTDRDVTKREAAKAARGGWPVCTECLEILKAGGPDHDTRGRE